MEVMCVPPVHACGNEDAGHYCARKYGHLGQHTCTCYRTWGIDRVLERARILYRIWATVPYTEAPEIPSPKLVDAAVLAHGSPWWRMAEEMEKYDNATR